VSPRAPAAKLGGSRKLGCKTTAPGERQSWRRCHGIGTPPAPAKPGRVPREGAPRSWGVGGPLVQVTPGAEMGGSALREGMDAGSGSLEGNLAPGACHPRAAGRMWPKAQGSPGHCETPAGVRGAPPGHPLGSTSSSPTVGGTRPCHRCPPPPGGRELGDSGDPPQPPSCGRMDGWISSQDWEPSWLSPWRTSGNHSAPSPPCPTSPAPGRGHGRGSPRRGREPDPALPVAPAPCRAARARRAKASSAMAAHAAAGRPATASAPAPRVYI